MAATNLPGFVPPPPVRLVLHCCKSRNLHQFPVQSHPRVRPKGKIGLLTGTTFRVAEGLDTP